MRQRLTLSAVLAATLTVAAAQVQPAGQNLILVVVDGYGASLVNHTAPEQMKGLKEIETNGVKANYLKPVFPTTRVPSWTALATGLYTESHGKTGNYMWDRKKDKKYFGGTGKNDDDLSWWWDYPKPFWSLADAKTFSVFCYWFSYCHESTGRTAIRVPKVNRFNINDPMQTERMPDEFDKIIQKFKYGQTVRSQVALIRYGGVDTALRQYGSGKDAEFAITTFDNNIKLLQDKIEAAGLWETTNLIVLSEHGLSRVENDEGDVVHIEECLEDYDNVQLVVGDKSVLQVFVKNPETTDNIDKVFYALEICAELNSDDNVRANVYKKSTIPDELHFKNSRNLGDVIVVPKPGVTLTTRELKRLPPLQPESETRVEYMSDGLSNEEESMQGIFFARGPAFNVGESIEHIELVDVYGLVTNILSVTGHPNNGSWARIEPLLQDSWEDRAKPSSGSTLLPHFFCTISSLLLATLLLR